MKRILRELLLVCLFILTVQAAFAYDFEVDGIYYDYIYASIDNPESVAVTFENYYGGTDTYKGELVIPSKVTYNGTELCISSIRLRAFTIARH